MVKIHSKSGGIFLRVILIDDEPLALEYLGRQLEKNRQIEIVKKFTYFEIGKYHSLLKEVDLVFLDIEMPGINGLELAEQMTEINSSLSIVFVTAFNEYAVQAFDLNALDYLIKPVKFERLQKSLERVEMKKNQRKLPLTNEKELRINVCGKLTFEQTEGHFELIKWRTAKTQELFLYLLHLTGKTIRKSKLIELLWPNFEQDRAYSQLYTAIYNIRKTINQYKEFLSIKSVQEGYVLFIKNTTIDIVEWERTITSLPPIHFDSINTYETVMALYTDSYLKDYDYLWAESERFRLEQLWVRTARSIADYYAKHIHLEKAIDWYIEICELRPDDVNANFALMKLYADLGYGLLVDYQYNQLERSLRDLTIQMDYEIQQWFENWRANQRIHRDPLRN